MSKKELREKIARNKKIETIRHEMSEWFYENLRELCAYVEDGTDYGLREKAHHAIVYLIGWAKKNMPGFNTPWFVYY